jgi:hypothetical protein
MSWRTDAFTNYKKKKEGEIRAKLTTAQIKDKLKELGVKPTGKNKAALLEEYERAAGFPGRAHREDRKTLQYTGWKKEKLQAAIKQFDSQASTKGTNLELAQRLAALEAKKQDGEPGEEAEEAEAEEEDFAVVVPQNPTDFLWNDPTSIRILHAHPLFADSALFQELESFCDTEADLKSLPLLNKFVQEEIAPLSTQTHIVEGAFSTHDTLTEGRERLTSARAAGEQRFLTNKLKPFRARYAQQRAEEKAKLAIPKKKLQHRRIGEKSFREEEDVYEEEEEEEEVEEEGLLDEPKFVKITRKANSTTKATHSSLAFLMANRKELMHTSEELKQVLASEFFSTFFKIVAVVVSTFHDAHFQFQILSHPGRKELCVSSAGLYHVPKRR